MYTPVIVKMAFTGAMTCALVTMTGCTWFKGSGSESSELSITNKQKCDVDLSQAARAAGLDDTDVVEDINVQPDCTVLIKFRSLSGDSIVEIESGDVLYGGQERTPEPSPEPASESAPDS